MVLEQRGTCPVCLRNSSITKHGLIRMHLVPKELAGGKSRGNCDGSGQAPAVEADKDEPTRPWEPETHVLALAYNQMHRQLCPRGMFCSEHQPAYGLLDAAHEQRNSLRSTLFKYEAQPTKT